MTAEGPPALPDGLGRVVSSRRLTGGDIATTWQVTTTDGARLVDYIRSFTAKPVKAVLFTHWHGDHPQGASEVVAAWPGVRVIATEQTRAGIDGPGRGQGQDYTPSAAWEATVTKQVNDAIAGLEGQLADPATGAGARARIKRYGRMPPGVHVDGWSAWLYPLEVPK